MLNGKPQISVVAKPDFVYLAKRKMVISAEIKGLDVICESRNWSEAQNNKDEA